MAGVLTGNQEVKAKEEGRMVGVVQVEEMKELDLEGGEMGC